MSKAKQHRIEATSPPAIATRAAENYKAVFKLRGRRGWVGITMNFKDERISVTYFSGASARRDATQFVDQTPEALL